MHVRRFFVVTWFALCWLASGAAAQPPSGSPALWRVAMGDHELVVLGSLVPLPKNVRWNQAPIEAHLANSEALIEPPGIDFTGGFSWLGTLWRLPTLIRARNNPAERTLDSVLPAPLLRRWERQRELFLAGQRSIDRRRPMAAADALQEKAMEEFGLDLDNQVAQQVSRLARRSGVARIDTALPVNLDTVNAFLDAVAQQPLDDQACFERVLERVEAGPDRLYAQAELWRSGMLSELLSNPLADTFLLCAQVLLSHPAARAHGIDDLPERVRANWLAVAEKTLQTHRHSVAVLPLSLALGESGYLAQLERRGFRVEPAVISDQSRPNASHITQR